jgi:hypothetical protein
MNASTNTADQYVERIGSDKAGSGLGEFSRGMDIRAKYMVVTEAGYGENKRVKLFRRK